MDETLELWIKGTLCLVAAVAVWWAARPGLAVTSVEDSSPTPSSPAAPAPSKGRMKRRHRRRAELSARARAARAVLLLLGMVSVAAYYNFGGFHGAGYVHHWEQYHYHLGSEYFPELAYDGLYAASIAAQTEEGMGDGLYPWVRDLRTNQVVPLEAVRLHGQEVKERFSAARWQDFLADNGYFVRANHPNYIAAIRKDHGYNPTPTWTFMGQLGSSFIEAGETDLAALQLLGMLDPLLLGVLFGFIFSTYGARVGSLCLILFGLGYAGRFYWIGGAFLRLDWMVAVGIAVCLMKREHYRWAGALLAYAGMVRIFPFALLLGPGVLALKAFLERQDTRWVWRFAQGFVLSLVLCILAGSLTGRGFGAWGEFTANLDKHHGTWLTNNVGLENLVLYDLDTVQRSDVDFRLPEPWIFWQGKMDRLKVERRWITGSLAAFFMLLITLAAWRSEKDASILLGFGAVFSLTLLTCYYWLALLLVPLRGGWRAARTSTVVLLLLWAGLYGLDLATPSFELIYGAMSWALALLLLAWVAPDAWRTVQELRGRPDGTRPWPLAAEALRP